MKFRNQAGFFGGDLRDNVRTSLVVTILLFISMAVSAQIPDQVIGRGGAFSSINLNDFNEGQSVIWSVEFLQAAMATSPPDWSVSGTNYSFEMNVTARVKSKGKLATGSEHLLAVRDADGAIRGVAEATQVGADWIYFMTVYGNQAGEDLSYVFYDTAYLEPIQGQTFSFNPNEVVGQPDAPLTVIATILELDIVDNQLTVDLIDQAYLGSEKVVVEAFQQTDASLVLRDTIDFTIIDNYVPQFTEVPVQVVAYGESFPELDLNQYLMLSDDDPVTISAEDHSELSIAINEGIVSLSYPSGWSGSEWITFTVTDNTTYAFSDEVSVNYVVRPEEVKPLVSNLPDRTTGIGGKPASIILSDYLITNNQTGISWNVSPYHPEQGSRPDWNVNALSFEQSMNMTCVVYSYGELQSGSTHLLGAFNAADSSLIGVTEATLTNGQYYYFLTIYGNSSVDSIFFQFYDASLEATLSIAETETFVANAVIGDPLEPLILNAGKIKPSIIENRLAFDLIDENWSGEEYFVVTATDTTTTNSLNSSDTLKVSVIDIVAPRLKAVDPIVILEGENFGPIDLGSYLEGLSLDKVLFTIAGADALSPQLNQNRVNLTIPNPDYFGKSELEVVVQHVDFPELIDQMTIVLQVNNINDAPFWVTAFEDRLVKVGEAYEIELLGEDVDSPELEIKVSGLPTWLRFISNGGFGVIFGTPQIEDEGIYNLIYEITDGELLEVKSSVISVTNSYAELLELPSLLLEEGATIDAIDLKAITNKTDNYEVIYAATAAENLLAEIVEDTLLNLVLNDLDWHGTELVVISLLDASNPDIVLDQITLTVNVTNVNDAPEILTTTLPDAIIEQNYYARIDFDDIDSEDLTVEIVSMPAWIAHDSFSEGIVLFGLPLSNNMSDNQISIKVSDGLDETVVSYTLKMIEILSVEESPEVLIYPNPTSKLLFIDAVSVRSIDLLDVSGRLIYQTSEMQLDVSQLAVGTYTLRIINKTGQVVSRRFVKN